ncbi:MAG TPA: SDR family oxidoreductase [Thermoanaerobaculia bacterium]|nr:SDR family oxidoreductase [Thermoanaerobaculia bacterium]
MRTLFFTGYPGFLGSALLPRVLARDPKSVAVCLVQPKFASLARDRARGLGDRVHILEGDLTAPINVSPADVAEIYHLAAIYDLSVSRDRGMCVNVDGTRNVLDFAERCTSLQRLHYISTCYVSGRYDGVFREDDLDFGQRFNNYYEETKFLAEVQVRKRIQIPSTIYRPAVVVGDSQSGATQKYDGPYYVMQWILRQPRIAVLPVVGRPKKHRFNVVPRDFIIDAIDYLSSHGKAQCYQLADPAPLTVNEILTAIASATQHKIIRVPLPLAVAKLGAPLLRIPPAAVNYFTQSTVYDTTNAQRDLAGSSISVPRFSDYAARLVEFVRTHPDIPAAGMA